MKDFSNPSEHIPQWKVEEIANIKELVKSYRIFGVLSFEGIMADQIQSMRRNLRGSAVLKVSRNTLIDRAFDECGDDVAKMKEYVSEQTAVIFTNENPFKLYKMLEQTKTPSPIKAGALAPHDIIVEKGPTGFPPGPVLGELQSAGIPVGVDGGKIAVKETKTVCKAGEKVSQKLAAALTKLEIYPMEVGLIMRAAFEDGSIYMPEDLAIDETKYFNDFVSGVQSAFNLSVNAAYPTKCNIETLLAKANSEAVNLGVNAVIFAPEVMDTLLAKANGEMMSVAGIAASKDGAAVDDEISAALGSAAAAAAAAPVAAAETVAAEPEAAEEESSEEDGMAGLGALFG